MRSRDDPRGRDGGGPQVELCKRRSARERRGRLAADAAQVPRDRRGWPYRGFIVCVG